MKRKFRNIEGIPEFIEVKGFSSPKKLKLKLKAEGWF